MTSNCTFKYALFSRNISGILKILAHSNICKMNKFFILLLLNIILPYTGFTQNPLLVEYDCKTGTLDKPFPFDQSFVVRLKNIPPEWEKVKIEIREVRKLRSHVKDLSRPDKICFKEKLRACTDKKTNDKKTNDDKTNDDKTKIDNADLFSKLKPTFKHEYERVKNFKGDTLEFLQLGYFRPNTDYVFDISSTGFRNLSRQERTELTNYLDSKHVANRIMINLYKEYVLDNQLFENMTSFVEKENFEINEIIRDYNKYYQFKNLTEVELKKIIVDRLKLAGDFTSSLKALNADIKKFCESKQKDAWDFESTLKSINFTNYKVELKNSFDNWKKQISATDDELTNYAILDGYNDLVDGLYDMLRISTETVTYIVDQRVTTFSSTIMGTTYFSGATENARTYLSVDAGYGANMTTRNEFPYLGVNIYLRPIKREIPLRHYHGNFCDLFSSRFSFLVGMTTNSIESDPMRGGIIGNKAILLGGGVRILPWLKLNYGRMVYYDMPANPLVNRRYLASDGFISASIDTDVVEIFKTFFKLK